MATELTTYSIDYHTISDTDLARFNRELKRYTKDNWVPYGSVSVATCGFGIETHTVYCVLLSKTSKVELDKAV